MSDQRANILQRQASMASAIALQKGFDSPTWANLPGKLMFVISELVELTDEGAVDIPHELADVAIRMLGILSQTFDSWSQRGAASRGEPAPLVALQSGAFASMHMNPHVTPSGRVWSIVRWLTKALKAWRHGQVTGAVDARTCIELALNELCQLSDELGVDIERAIAEKCKINATRPRLHGYVETLG